MALPEYGRNVQKMVDHIKILKTGMRETVLPKQSSRSWAI
jgi:hypothetical protein